MENGNVIYQSDSGGAVSDNSIQEALARYIGRYVMCELLIGLRSMTIREGILMEVGQSYFMLQNPNGREFTSCDLYSLKFFTVLSQGQPQGSGESYCPYGYKRPSMGSACASPRTACWMQVD